MMMLKDRDEYKIALEDARTRHASLLQLIYLVDQQAMSLLRLYVPVGVAAASTATAGLKGVFAIPTAPAVGLFGTAVILFVGTIFCFRAMKTAELSLPGRDGKFWRWAMDTEEVDLRHAVSEYLTELDTGMKENLALNKRSSRQLQLAKKAGIAAAPVALVSGLLAWLVELYFPRLCVVFMGLG